MDSSPTPALTVRPLPLRRAHRRRLAMAACAALLLAWRPAHAQPAAAAPDADIVAAKAAFDRGDAPTLAALASRTRNHVLAPYVTFWQYELQLDSTDPAALRAFLQAWPGTPFADKLRADWLKALARRGDWVQFAQDYVAPPNADDVELACAGILYRRQRDGDGALRDAQPLWYTGQSTPSLCEPLFNALIAKQAITTTDRVARVRLAAEAGNVRMARMLAEALPASTRVPAAQFVAVEHDPLRVLGAGPYRWNEQGSHVLALYALERAARSNAAAARAPWVKIRGNLTPEERAYGNGRIAYHASRQLVADSTAWYREGDAGRFNVEQRTWRVRAALRAGDWPGVLAAIGALPPAVTSEAAWRYWHARALVATGRAAEALPIQTKLADEFNFYGILAAEGLGRRVNPVSAPVEVGDAWLAEFGARPDVLRVLKLAALDMRMESLREWAVVIRGYDDDTLLRASEFARRAGLNDRSINTAERTASRHDFNLRYPTPFAAQFASAAQAQRIDVTLLYGIARQESRFVPDIVSSAGAMGLMQLMPPTARWVSKQLNRQDYRGERITDIEMNSQFGAYYLKYWLERLDNQPALAAAAYNAGPGRAQAWRPQATPLEGAIWVETIPFNETRDYVKKVLSNEMIYARALSAPYVSMTDRLGTVQPRNAAPAPAPALARNG